MVSELCPYDMAGSSVSMSNGRSCMHTELGMSARDVLDYVFIGYFFFIDDEYNHKMYGAKVVKIRFS